MLCLFFVLFLFVFSFEGKAARADMRRLDGEMSKTGVDDVKLTKKQQS